MSAVFENTDLVAMQEYMDRYFQVSQSSINPTMLKLLDWANDIIEAAIQNSDLKNIKKEDVIKLVKDMYAKYIEPIDLPGPDLILDPMLLQMILKQAEKVYDMYWFKQTNQPVPSFDPPVQ